MSLLRLIFIQCHLVSLLCQQYCGCIELLTASFGRCRWSLSHGILEAWDTRSSSLVSLRDVLCWQSEPVRACWWTLFLIKTCFISQAWGVSRLTCEVTLIYRVISSKIIAALHRVGKQLLNRLSRWKTNGKTAEVWVRVEPRGQPWICFLWFGAGGGRSEKQMQHSFRPKSYHAMHWRIMRSNDIMFGNWPPDAFQGNQVGGFSTKNMTDWQHAPCLMFDELCSMCLV